MNEHDDSIGKHASSDFLDNDDRVPENVGKKATKGVI